MLKTFTVRYSLYTLKTNKINEYSNKFASFENAMDFAKSMDECIDIVIVTIVDSQTGEVIWDSYDTDEDEEE